MLGWRAAANLGLGVGDQFDANGTSNTVVGIYSTGNSFGDAGAMFPLPALQGYNRVPGIVTLAFVKVTPGASPAKVAATTSTTPSRSSPPSGPPPSSAGPTGTSSTCRPPSTAAPSWPS